MKLHLGVIDVPEPYDSKTTGQVGKELEEHYKLFSSFYDFKQDEIVNKIAEDAAIGMERLLKGEDVTIGNTFGPTSTFVTKAMQNFITSKEAETYARPSPPYTVPTLAAQAGTSYRFNRGVTAKRYVKGQKGLGTVKEQGPARPSFLYSGVLEASLLGWVE